MIMFLLFNWFPQSGKQRQIIIQSQDRGRFSGNTGFVSLHVLACNANHGKARVCANTDKLTPTAAAPSSPVCFVAAADSL
jgi:hypothetical protein